MDTPTMQGPEAIEAINIAVPAQILPPSSKSPLLPVSIRSFSLRKVVLQACGLWIVTRVLLISFTYMAVTFATSKTPLRAFTPGELLNAWSQWDAGFFLSIAHFGYYAPLTTVYYPVYPLLIHFGTLLLGDGKAVLASVLVSHLASLIAFIGLAVLAAELDGSERTARNLIRVTAAYPVAFFLAAPYSEAVFMALVVWMLVCMCRGQWYGAAACAFIAGFTRATAIILILPLLWEFGRKHGWWSWLWQQRARRGEVQLIRIWIREARQAWSADSQRNALVLLKALLIVEAVPLSFAIYALYCQIRFGNPWTFTQSEIIYWLHVPMPPWNAIALVIRDFIPLPAGSYAQSRYLLDVVPLVLFTVITIVGVRRLPFSFTLYMGGLLLLCISAPIINGPFPYVLMSISRFLILSIPVFLLLARWCERYAWLDMLIVSGGFLLQALFLSFYLQGGWVV